MTTSWSDAFMGSLPQRERQEIPWVREPQQLQQPILLYLSPDWEISPTHNENDKILATCWVPVPVEPLTLQLFNGIISFSIKNTIVTGNY
jgi:hypothetical protein